MTTILTVEQWDSAFKPIKNWMDDNASWDGVMFETYGQELEFVKSAVENYVWTYMDGDEGTWLTAGYHVVNRIGYFVTKEPWEDRDTLVEVSKDDEGEDV